MPYTWRQPDYPGDDSDKSWIAPSLIVIFTDSDLDVAIEPLLRTLHEPIAQRLIGTVFVQEAIREKFMELVRQKMDLMHRPIRQHSYYTKALDLIDCLSAEVVTLQTLDDIGFISKMSPGSPLLVCEFNQSFFNSRRPSTVVTMHTFRDVRELPRMLKEEPLQFVSAAVWCNKIAGAFEAALVLNVPTVYINCAAVSILPIMPYYEERRPYSMLINDYHYELLVTEGRRKIIILPAVIPAYEEPPEPEPEVIEKVPSKAVSSKHSFEFATIIVKPFNFPQPELKC